MAARLARLSGQASQDVVSLEARHHQSWDVEALGDLPAHRHLGDQLFGNRLAGRLVAGELVVSKGGSGRIKGGDGAVEALGKCQKQDRGISIGDPYRLASAVGHLRKGVVGAEG